MNTCFSMMTNVTHSRALVLCLLLANSMIGGRALAEESDKKSPAAVEAKCPITGEASDTSFASKYEGKTYHFCSAACVEKFTEARAKSLYGRLGGKAAIDATVDLFYKKILADKRVNHFFEDINMKRQIRRQKAFIGTALGGPEPWTGKDLRKAHASLDLTEADFGAIAEHLQASLSELKVPADLIKEVMTIVGSTKAAVLNQKKPAGEKKPTE